jgi:hypothetical protein
MWTAADIEIELDDEATAGSVVTARISCPAGQFTMMGELRRFDRELALCAVHIQGDTVGPNTLGWARLRQIARAVAEKADVDTIIVEGAARTTGATHGRIPRPLRFTRTVRPQC